MPPFSRKYYSKILLFGEYTVLHGSKALAIPYHGLYGQLQPSEKASSEMAQFIKFIKANTAETLWDFDRLNQLEKSVIFDSNIPIGYGAGSSGALTAAVADYALIKARGYSIEQLKSVLASVENYFHGSSSGTDPLVSFLNSGIVIEKESIELVSPLLNAFNFDIYLVDSGKSRSTEPLVKAYKKELKDSKAFENASKEMAHISDLTLDSFLEINPKTLVLINQLSQLQLEHFQNFIPDEIFKLWKEGLKKENVFFKMCGAGGGGYFLAFAKKDKKINFNNLAFKAIG